MSRAGASSGATAAPVDSQPDHAAAALRVARAVKAAQAGDPDAIAYIYARYADNVYGYVRSIVSDSHDAEDVTQQIFMKLTYVIGKYEEREVPFFAWILRVARNVALDHLRAQRATPVAEVRSALQANEADDQAVISGLRDALSAVPKDQREVLVLRHFLGMSPLEIALRVGRSEGSVHGLHHRGRRTLREELSRRGLAPITTRWRSQQANVGG